MPGTSAMRRPRPDRQVERGDVIWRLRVIERVPRTEIAQRYGLTVQRVDQIVSEVRKSLSERDKADIRADRVAELDELRQLYMGYALSGSLKAAKMVLQIDEREARYLGLDSPTKVLTADLNGDQLVSLQEILGRQMIQGEVVD